MKNHKKFQNNLSYSYNTISTFSYIVCHTFSLSFYNNISTKKDTKERTTNVKTHALPHITYTSKASSYRVRFELFLNKTNCHVVKFTSLSPLKNHRSTCSANSQPRPFNFVIKRAHARTQTLSHPLSFIYLRRLPLMIIVPRPNKRNFSPTRAHNSLSSLRNFASKTSPRHFWLTPRTLPSSSIFARGREVARARAPASIIKLYSRAAAATTNKRREKRGKRPGEEWEDRVR